MIDSNLDVLHSLKRYKKMKIKTKLNYRNIHVLVISKTATCGKFLKWKHQISSLYMQSHNKYNFKTCETKYSINLSISLDLRHKTIWNHIFKTSKRKDSRTARLVSKNCCTNIENDGFYVPVTQIFKVGKTHVW